MIEYNTTPIRRLIHKLQFISTMTAANATSVQQTEGLSKSQKKRMKQKAKKLQDQQLEEQLHQQERQTNTKPMQQQKETALVESLLEQGFTKEQITKAQEQLWNAGKGGYDDVWAVSDLLMRMNGGNGMKDGDEKDDSDDDDDSDYEDDSSEEESEEDDSEDESDDSEEEDDDDNAEVEVEVDVKIVDAEIREGKQAFHRIGIGDFNITKKKTFKINLSFAHSKFATPCLPYLSYLTNSTFDKGGYYPDK